MIVLVSCSINSLASNQHIPSTGDLDSTKIAYSDLRIVNSKLIELKYEKEINKQLSEIIENDSVIINNYQIINKELNNKNKKYKKQRNIFGISTIVFIFVTIINL